MNVMLGNLNANEVEKRLGIKFPEELKDFMKQNNQQAANDIKKGRWHCFDIPFCIVCGDIETATKIYTYLKEKSNDVKEPLNFYVQN